VQVGVVLLGAMDNVRGKCGEAYGDIFSSFGFRAAVMQPLPRRYDHGLAGLHVDGTIL
jgi:hypothetical protein